MSDEIERLQAQIAVALREHSMRMAEIELLRNELALARAALRRHGVQE